MEKEIFERLNPTQEQRDRIYGEIIKSMKYKKVHTFLFRKFSAIACALILIGGTTVYAAHTNWLVSLFGGSSVISENSEDYLVETTDFKYICSDENYPYNISFGDIISDGTILYGEMLVTDNSGNRIIGDNIRLEADIIINKDIHASRQSGITFLNENEDGSAVFAFSTSTDKEISAGDSVNVIISEYDIPSAEKLWSTEYSFEILDIPQTFARCINPNCTANFTSCEGNKAEMKINSIVLSPLRLSIKGHCINYNNYSIISNSPYFRINFSDGSYLEINNKRWIYNADLSNDSTLIKAGESICESFGFIGLKSESNDEYDIDFDAQFRCVLPIEEIVSVTIGDVTIPIE